MENKKIPLKKVTIAQVIKPDYTGLKLKIKDTSFIGTGFYVLREDMAPKTFINKVNELEIIKEMDGRHFEYLTDSKYFECSDSYVEYRLADSSCIVLKTAIGDVGLNYNYYSYFKKLGLELRFHNMTSPVGMFKDDELVGIILPTIIKGGN